MEWEAGDAKRENGNLGAAPGQVLQTPAELQMLLLMEAATHKMRV